MMRYMFLLALFVSVNVHPYQVLQECEATEASANKFGGVFDFYIRCGDEESYPVEGYSKVHSLNDSQYRDLLHLYKDGSLVERGVAIKNPFFASLEAGNFGRFLTIVSSHNNAFIMDVYNKKIESLLNCLRQASCSKKVFREYGFFRRLFDKDFRKFSEQYERFLADGNAIGEGIRNIMLEDQNTLILTFNAAQNDIWSLNIDLSGVKPKLVSVREVIE